MVMVQYDPSGPRLEEWRYFLQLLEEVSQEQQALLEEVSQEQQALLEERARLRARVRELEADAGQEGGQP
jgi:chromosome condensin MukBEF ATPase and DNA-binding subunit MukB